MRALIPAFLIAFLSLGCGSQILDLTKENLQSSLCRRGHQFRYKSEGVEWVCWRVLYIEQKNPDYVKVRVKEEGLKYLKKWYEGGYGHPRYENVSRVTVYEIKRDSNNGDWIIDTSNGVPIRRFWFFKRRLKIKADTSPMPGESKKPSRTQDFHKSVENQEAFEEKKVEKIPVPE